MLMFICKIQAEAIPLQLSLYQELISNNSFTLLEGKEGSMNTYDSNPLPTMPHEYYSMFHLFHK